MSETDNTFNATGLDWTHVNETILMIGLAVAQIEKTLNDGDDSISVLTGSFIQMMASVSTIANSVKAVKDPEEVDLIVASIEKKLKDSGLAADKIDEIKEEISGLTEMSNLRGDIIKQADDTSLLIQDTIVAFQFYDRLSQRLHQIVSSLGMMSQLFADNQRLHNPYEWAELQDSIKSRYTIDADRIMFDALLAGASIDEAVEIAGEYEDEAETPETEIELF
jgi:hypothetical protein